MLYMMQTVRIKIPRLELSQVKNARVFFVLQIMPRPETKFSAHAGLAHQVFIIFVFVCFLFHSCPFWFFFVFCFLSFPLFVCFLCCFLPLSLSSSLPFPFACLLFFFSLSLFSPFPFPFGFCFCYNGSQQRDLLATLRKIYPKVVSKGNVVGSWVKLYTAVFE